jgi:hypothetical protein
MNSACNNIPDLPDHCELCGAKYRSIQHPLKPPGVTMIRVCDCKPVYSCVTDPNGNSIATVTLVPPDRSDPK